MRYLLDTCVISELTKPRPYAALVKWVKSQDELLLFLSVITFGELEKGIEKLADGKKKQSLRQWVDHDLRKRFEGRLLTLDYEIACRWGQLAAKAEADGRPMPVVDGWLAATASIHGLTLVTRNTDDVAGSGVPVLNPWTDF